MFCYLPHCWSLDSGNVHTFGECWLKWQVNIYICWLKWQVNTYICWLKWQVNARPAVRALPLTYSLLSRTHALTHYFTHYSAPCVLTPGEREASYLRPAR